MVVGSGGGDGRGGGQVFSRGKGDHVVVGDAFPKQGCKIRAVWAWTIFMLNSFGAVSPFSVPPLPHEYFFCTPMHGVVCNLISLASLSLYSFCPFPM